MNQRFDPTPTSSIDDSAQNGGARPVLLVLTGTVGVGKSTSANTTAKQLRLYGLSVAWIDLDLVYGMLRQREGFDDPDIWRATRRCAAVMASHCFADASDVVIVEGGVHTPDELADIVDAPQAQHEAVFVSLHARYETVHARVMADSDPGRVASKVPALLQRLYTEYDAAAPFLREASTCIGLDALSAEQAGQHIAALVMAARAGPHPTVQSRPTSP